MRAVGVGSGKVNVQRAAALQALAAALRRVAYGPERLRECLGVRYPDDVGLLNHAPAVARCAGSAAADIAARLFYLENPESPAAVRRLLGAADTRALTEAGLLRAAAGRLRARLRVDVHGGLLLLADRRFAAPDATALGLPRGDMVYPPGTDSVMLAEAVPTREGERVLDLCTGSGIQALQVAPRAAGVTAVDIGLRAAALARCNAALNGIVGVTVRQGDLYAPVRGEQFDLVIANPPFVPARRRGPAYHSGGPRGDRVLRRVVAGLEAHLRPGGRAIAISHLALRRGETLQSAVGAVAARLRRSRADRRPRARYTDRPRRGAIAVCPRGGPGRVRARGARLARLPASATDRRGCRAVAGRRARTAASPRGTRWRPALASDPALAAATGDGEELVGG